MMSSEKGTMKVSSYTTLNSGSNTAGFNHVFVIRFSMHFPLTKSLFFSVFLLSQFLSEKLLPIAGCLCCFESGLTQRKGFTQHLDLGEKQSSISL